MKIAFFDTHPFETDYFSKAASDLGHEITYFHSRLMPETVGLARNFPCVCAFVNDQLKASVVRELFVGGTRLIALRSAGFNHVDLVACQELGVTVVRVPEYSPHAVAEHAIALILSLNRKIHRAYNRVREGNFSLTGLVGFDLYRKTIGIVGTGRIGGTMAQIMVGFGCQVLACDLEPRPELKTLGVTYVGLDELLIRSDIISLHVPLTPQTHHLIDQAAFSKMKKGVMLINTGRGALIDTKALISALKDQSLGSAGLDVYEEEEGIFFEDLSESILQDDTLARLLTFPNVLLTSHQAFLTKEALTSIAETTMDNITAFEKALPLKNQVTAISC